MSKNLPSMPDLGSIMNKQADLTKSTTSPAAKAVLPLPELPQARVGQGNFSDEQDNIATQVFNIAISKLHDNPKNGRRKYKEENISRLAASIEDAGFRGVVEVIRHPEKTNEFQLIYGHQRKRAAMHAGKSTMPCIIVEEEALCSRKTSFYENFVRTDISVIEQAQELQALKDDFDELSNVELAKMTGMSESNISRFFKLLDLPEDVQNKIDDGLISYGQAKFFIPLLKEEGGSIFISQLAEKVCRNNWTVKELQRYIKASEKVEAEDLTDPELVARQDSIASMEQILKNDLKSSVAIKPSKNKGGKIVLTYGSQEELQRLFESLSISTSSAE